MFVVSLSVLMMFGGQTSKNIHDVRKVCLETTLCVLACFVKFYVLVLDEVHLGGLNLYKNIFGLETSGLMSSRTN